MVRLVEIDRKTPIPTDRHFNSRMVRLVVDYGCGCGFYLEYFNSRMVRLVAEKLLDNFLDEINFNSRMVRLVGGLPLMIHRD